MLKRAVVPCAVLLSVLAACSGGSDDSAGRVQKVSQTKKLASIHTLNVSPDGKWLVSVNDGDHDLCITAVAGGEKHCEDTVRADENSLTWAPDSSKIAFTEPFFREFREPDIWTMDTSGKTRDLTDDQVTKISFGKIPSGTDVDVFPSWNDDSSKVTFLRLRQIGEGTDEVRTVPADGGDSEQVGTIKLGSALNAFTASPDGKKVAWSESPDLPAKVYVADTSGSDKHRISDSGKLDSGLLRFSADSDYLVLNNLAAADFSRAKKAAVHVVKVDDGSSTSLGDGSLGAGWSASGHSLVFIQNSQLKVLPAPDEKARTLSGGKDLLAGYGNPVWSKENSVVYFQHGAAMLLTLA
ncbi:MAG TPA: hypothetical protein VHC49_19190 [Mycobacteriales bacterium]|nr:hypothetical protein [Mycobacteriales bacterium]